MPFPDEDLTVIVEVYLGADPTANPSTWPAATDLSSRLMREPIHVQRGRRQNQKSLASGSCTFWLDNADAALTPLLATSTYYPNWDLGVPMRISVAGVGPNPPYVRFAGFVADIQARMVPGGNGVNISAVQVTLGGVWRRISQGAVAKSVMERFVEANSPTSWWALDAGSEADELAPGVPGDPPMVVYGYANPVVPATGSGTLAPWLADGLLLDTSTILAATHTPVNGGWTMDVLYNIAASRGDKLSISFIMFDGGASSTPGSTPNISVRMFGSDMGGGNAGTAKVGYPNTNTEAASAALPTTAMLGNTLHHIRLKAVDAGGGNYTLSSWLDGVALVSATVAGTLVYGSPALLVVDEVLGSGNHDGVKVAVGWVSIWTGTPPTLADAVAAANGQRGEQAHTRAARVCAEEGIPFSGTASLSNELGPQPIDDITGVLTDLEAVDHGMLTEDFAWGLGYRASTQRENLNAAMTIDLSTYRTTAGTQSDVLTPVRNDQRIRNEWTISRPEGSSTTVKDEAHQAKRGRYNDSADVNVQDDTRLVDEAQWRVHEGTFDGLRYQTIPLDLAANQ